MSARRGTFTRRVGLTVATQVTSLAVAVASSIVLARFLGPSGKGAYSVAYLLPSMLVMLVTLGVPTAAAYYVANESGTRSTTLGATIFISGATSLSGVLLGLVAIALLSDSALRGVPTGILLLALTLVPLELYFSSFQNALLGAQKIREYNVASLVQQLLYVGLVALLVAWLRAGVAGAIVAAILSWLSNTVLLYRRTTRTVGQPRFSSIRARTRDLVRYGVRAHLFSVLGYLNYRIDMLLVNLYLGTAWVGQYSIGVALAEKLWLIGSSAGTVLFPMVANADETDRSGFTALVVRVSLALTVLAAGILVLVARPLVIALYSSRYAPSVTAFQLLLPGVVSLSAARVLTSDISARGFPGLNAAVAGIAAAANLALNVAWIPRFGIAGASLASSVSYTVQLVGSLVVFSRLTGRTWREVLVPTRRDFSLLTDSLARAVRRRDTAPETGN